MHNGYRYIINCLPPPRERATRFVNPHSRRKPQTVPNRYYLGGILGGGEGPVSERDSAALAPPARVDASLAARAARDTPRRTSETAPGHGTDGDAIGATLGAEVRV